MRGPTSTQTITHLQLTRVRPRTNTHACVSGSYTQNPSRLSRHLSLDRMEYKAPAEAETKADDKAKTKTKEDEKAKDGEKESHKPKKKRKFDATGYPASRPMHKEVCLHCVQGGGGRDGFRASSCVLCILMPGCLSICLYMPVFCLMSVCPLRLTANG